VTTRGWEHGALGRNVGAGVRALRAHRLRTGLTALGVVFGVGAVICMLAIGKGAEQRVLHEIRRLGVRNLHVEERQAPVEKTGSSTGLVEEDARALVDAFAPAVRGAAAVRSGTARVRLGTASAEAQLAGVTSDYASFLDLKIVAGRFLGDLDLSSRAAVCVLSQPLAAALVPAGEALGTLVRCRGQALRVVGVVRGGAVGSDGPPPLYVPLSTARHMLPRGRDPRQVQRLVVRLAPAADPAQLAPVLTTALLRRHSGVHDFAVVVPAELMRREQRAQRVFQWVMGSLASVSLLVGGIGIANIMFASVLERTAEIGLRRAVGARRVDILTQFLFEAAAIAMLGGLVGVVLGLGGAYLVAHIARWPVVVTPASLVLSTGTAVVTGLVSGSAPARHAASVEAIVALHHE
jgi:putative ABC transport system permease protein